MKNSLEEDLEEPNNICILKIKKQNDNISGISIEKNMNEPSFKNSNKIKLEKHEKNDSEDSYSIRNLKESIDMEIQETKSLKKKKFMFL